MTLEILTISWRRWSPSILNWPAAEDKLLVVSIGTGTSPDANADLKPGEMNLLYNADLQRVARAVADRKVKGEHFAGF